MSISPSTLTTKPTVLFGSDPEVFLKDINTGAYVSAIGKFVGTKDRPVPVRELGKGFAKQVDNVLVEYNIPAVQQTKKWIEAHTSMLDYLGNEAKGKGLVLSIDASAEMPDSELQDPMALVFGCEPDFNAWTLQVNNPPRSTNPNLRSAGGHIHIGKKMDEVQKINLIRYMDIVIGAWSVIDDDDIKRKELYGRPGAMRFKPYGVEYRTVSNFWLKTKESMATAFELARLASRYGLNYNAEAVMPKVLSMFEHNDKAVAAELLAQHGVGDLKKFKKAALADEVRYFGL